MVNMVNDFRSQVPFVRREGRKSKFFAVYHPPLGPGVQKDCPIANNSPGSARENRARLLLPHLHLGACNLGSYAATDSGDIEHRRFRVCGERVSVEQTPVVSPVKDVELPCGGKPKMSVDRADAGGPCSASGHFRCMVAIDACAFLRHISAIRQSRRKQERNFAWWTKDRTLSVTIACAKHNFGVAAVKKYTPFWVAGL